MTEESPLSQDQPKSQNRDAEAIEAGEVTDVQELRTVKAHREVTTQRLAFLLVWIMGISMALHYVAVIVLTICNKETAAESLKVIFNAWLPVVSGLVGGACTYYFTREK
jgi:hypothetical protein